MPCNVRVALALLALAGLLGAPGCRSALHFPVPRAGPARSLLDLLAPPAESDLELAVDTPPEGTELPVEELAFVAGRAFAPPGSFPRFDVVFAIDTSGSTAEPVDADAAGGKRPRVKTRSGGSRTAEGSILAAEVAAARTLLRSVDPRSTRVGIVAFEGNLGFMGGARRAAGRVPWHVRTVVPLTRAFDEVESGLDAVLELGPGGQTHMVAALQQAKREFLLAEPAGGDSEKVVVFLSDGRPTLPFLGEPWKNDAAVLSSARDAAAERIRIFTYGVGPRALEEPAALIEMARVTGGVFTPVRHPADLVDVVRTLQLAELESVEVTNTTHGGGTPYTSVSPDGSWVALVPLAPGSNVLEIRARERGGREQVTHWLVYGAAGAEEPPVPEDLRARRSELLERVLADARRRREGLEVEVVEAHRRVLVLEIERERARAEKRTADQRKRLRMELGTGAEAAGGAGR